MTRDAFLQTLRRGLGGLPPKEIDEIIADYSAHFSDSCTHGRSEADVAHALGDPARIARELRADIGLKRLETEWSFSNLVAAAMALAGLAIVDVFFLLPLLFTAAILAFALAVSLVAVGAAGVKIVFTALLLVPTIAPTDVVAAICVGAGLVCLLVGGGALLLMATGAGIRVLGRYARLHFRLVQR